MTGKLHLFSYKKLCKLIVIIRFSGKSATFNILRELYATALKRDPAYNEYLTRIGELYFGLRAPSQQRDMGFLSSFFHSFLEDGDDDNETSGPSKSLAQHATEDLD